MLCDGRTFNRQTGVFTSDFSDTFGHFTRHKNLRLLTEFQLLELKKMAQR